MDAKDPVAGSRREERRDDRGSRCGLSENSASTNPGPPSVASGRTPGGDVSGDVSGDVWGDGGDRVRDAAQDPSHTQAQGRASAEAGSAPGAGPDSGAGPVPGAGMGKRFRRAAKWQSLESVIPMVVRPVTNIVIAQFLNPASFGLIGLATSVNGALQQFSDVGIRTSIIQSPRGEDPAFLDTAYTIQVVRGVALYVVALLIGLGAAYFRDQWILAAVMAVTSLQIVGFSLVPTRVHEAYRSLRVKRLTQLMVLGQLAGPLGAIGLALLDPLAGLALGVWVLVFRAAVPRWSQLALITWFLPGRRNRFAWDREAALEMFSFGRWVFLSTLVAGIAQYLDIFILAAFLSDVELGYYVMARSMGEMFPRLVLRMNAQLVYPALAETQRRRPQRFMARMAKARLGMTGLTIVLTVALMFAAPWLVDTLLPHRFADVGWILQLMVLQPLGTVLMAGYVQGLLARGDSRATFYLAMVQSIVRLSVLFIGAAVGGMHDAILFGVIIALVLSSFAVYLASVPVIAARSLWQPKIDLPIMTAMGALLALLFYTGVLTWNPPLINPVAPDAEAGADAGSAGALPAQVDTIPTPATASPDAVDAGDGDDVAATEGRPVDTSTTDTSSTTDASSNADHTKADNEPADNIPGGIEPGDTDPAGQPARRVP